MSGYSLNDKDLDDIFKKTIDNVVDGRITLGYIHKDTKKDFIYTYKSYVKNKYSACNFLNSTGSDISNSLESGIYSATVDASLDSASTNAQTFKFTGNYDKIGIYVNYIFSKNVFIDTVKISSNVSYNVTFKSYDYFGNLGSTKSLAVSLLQKKITIFKGTFPSFAYDINVFVVGAGGSGGSGGNGRTNANENGGGGGGSGGCGGVMTIIHPSDGTISTTSKTFSSIVSTYSAGSGGDGVTGVSFGTGSNGKNGNDGNTGSTTTATVDGVDYTVDGGKGGIGGYAKFQGSGDTKYNGGEGGSGGSGGTGGVNGQNGIQGASSTFINSVNAGGIGAAAVRTVYGFGSSSAGSDGIVESGTGTQATTGGASGGVFITLSYVVVT